MGLFINKDSHPDVFKNTGDIREPNQELLRKDYLSEIIQEQKHANTSFMKSFDSLQKQYLEQEYLQTSQWKTVSDKLSDLGKRNMEHTEFESQMMEWIKSLEEKNLMLETLLKKEEQFKQEITEQLNNQMQSHQEMADQLEKYETVQDAMNAKMNENLTLQRHIADQLTKQEEFQNGVLIRLEKQEALSEKISRQLTNIRSILFERTHYLADKVQEGYKLTSSYVHKLMTGSEQPFTIFLSNKKKEENHK